MALIRSFSGRSPRIAPSAFVAENATIIGDVDIGPNTSIWFGSVIRADVGLIRIGANCNIQDNAVLHTYEGGMLIEDDVTVGHGAILHGSRVGKACLIGMGAVLLGNSVIGAGCVVAAASLVKENSTIPPGHLAAGNPAEAKKRLEGDAAGFGAYAASYYSTLAKKYESERIDSPPEGSRAPTSHSQA